MRRIKWQFLSIISPVLFCQHVRSVCWITILPIARLTDSTGFWQFALLNRVSACSLSVFDSTWYNATNWTFVESKKEIVRTGELKQKWMPWQVPHWGTQTCRPHPFSVLTIQPLFCSAFWFYLWNFTVNNHQESWNVLASTNCGMQPRGCIWICRAKPFAPTPQCCVPVCCPMLVFGVSCFCVQDVIKWWNCFWTPSGVVCDKRVWLCEVLKTASEQSRNKNECSHKKILGGREGINMQK